jgi:glycosyltransferase involved in cell wall biosynthesis
VSESPAPADRPRVLMTTTAYPPSTGGVQAHIADLRHHLRHYQAEIVTLWRENRTDWLLGTTLRLGQGGTEDAAGVRRLSWTPAQRRRMLPWVLAYYPMVPVAAAQLSKIMAPGLDAMVTPAHVLIHNHRIGREFLALASLRVARRHNLPFVLTPHHHPKWRGYRYSGWLKVYRSADAVLTQTAAEAEELVRLGVDPQRLTVIWCAADDPLPGDASRFLARFFDPTSPLVLFVGQQYEYKGVAELVAAVDALHGRGIAANLAFIGPPTPFSTRFFEQNTRPWLRVLGRVPAQDKWDALEAAAVVCLPSRHEAFGRIYLEAWSKGKPVIGGRIPAVRDVIEDGRSGLLVTPGSVEELSQALERILADPALARQMGAHGALAVRERFNWPNVVGRVETAYAKALERVSGRRALSSPVE